MKRDFNLIKAFLYLIEKSEEPEYTKPIEIPGYTQEQIEYHRALLLQAGYLLNPRGFQGLSLVLSWRGHDYVDELRKKDEKEQQKNEREIWAA